MGLGVIHFICLRLDGTSDLCRRIQTGFRGYVGLLGIPTRLGTDFW